MVFKYSKNKKIRNNVNIFIKGEWECVHHIFNMKDLFKYSKIQFMYYINM